MKDTSMRITAERKMKLERLAIDISYKTGKTVKYTEIVNYMIDNYGNDVKEEFIEEAKIRG